MQKCIVADCNWSGYFDTKIAVSAILILALWVAAGIGWCVVRH